MAARTRTAAVVPRVQSKAVVTLAALLVLTVPGAAIGATTAQPGQPLYGAKLGIERARVALVDAPEGNVAAHVGLAEQRLQELDRLRSTDPQVVAQVSQNLNDHADAANERLRTVGSSARGELTRRLSEVVATHVNVLDTLVGVGCPDSGTEACLALGETQEESRVLRDRTPATVVAAVSEPGDPTQTGQEPAMGDTSRAIAPANTPGTDTADTGRGGAAPPPSDEQNESAESAADQASDNTSPAASTPSPTPTSPAATGAPAEKSTDEATEKPTNNGASSAQTDKPAKSEPSDERTSSPQPTVNP